MERKNSDLWLSLGCLRHCCNCTSSLLRGQRFAEGLPALLVIFIFVAEAALHRPQRPEIFVGSRVAFCSFAIRIDTGGICDQVRVAADRTAAIAVVGQQLGLVADADLPHLDPRLELAGQRPDQLAEIDPALGQIGQAEDFKLAAFNRLLRNAIDWAARRRLRPKSLRRPCPVKSRGKMGDESSTRIQL